MGANAEKLELVEPCEELKEAYLEMVKECREAFEYYAYHNRAMSDYRAFLKEVHAWKRGKDLPAGFVPMTTYWLLRDGGTILGESRLRSRLTPELEVEGGHIGYMIRPSERRKGYGTQILALVLLAAQRAGHRRVLVTCDTDNTGSARIIEKNGGILNGYSVSPQSGKQVSRYWIEIKKKLQNLSS
jgi:predicted acetyltransferase